MKASKSVSLLVVDEAMLIEEWGSSGFIVEWKQMRAILDQNKYIRFVGLSIGAIGDNGRNTTRYSCVSCF